MATYLSTYAEEQALCIRFLTAVEKSHVPKRLVASLVGIGRQAIYRWWQNGRVPTEHYEAALALTEKLEAALDAGLLPLTQAKAQDIAIRAILK